MGWRTMVSAAVCVALAALARGKVSRARLAVDIGLLAAVAVLIRLFDGIGATSSALFCAATAICTASGSLWSVPLAMVASAHGAVLPVAMSVGGWTGLFLAATAERLFVRVPGNAPRKVVRRIATAAFAALAVCTGI